MTGSACRSAVLLLLAALGGCDRRPSARMVLWAWERPEDMRFAAGKAEVAVQTGFVSIDGNAIRARGRRHPLRVGEPPSTAVVHVQIEPGHPLRWTPLLRRNLAAAVLHYAQVVPARRVQVDFEVRASERQALIEVLADVRRGLRAGTILSMTALASWCDTETWLEDAPVDEIVPMLFRMQRGAETIRQRLGAGGDFRNPRCRTALGISTDTPLPRAPRGRLVYVFAPQSWTASEFARVKDEVGRW